MHFDGGVSRAGVDMSGGVDVLVTLQHFTWQSIFIDNNVFFIELFLYIFRVALWVSSYSRSVA